MEMSCKTDRVTNESLQADEIQALSAIFDKEWVLEDCKERVYSINIAGSSANKVYLQIILSVGYPLDAPPIYRISAPWMSRDTKNAMCSALEEIYSQNIGESIIYLWIEKIREFIDGGIINEVEENENENLTHLCLEDVSDKETFNGITVLKGSDALAASQWTVDELPIIESGEAIVDRKSVFQAHVAKIVTVKQVGQVLQKLKENKKIAMATHNIFAYRISRENKAFIQDCEDDGETRAGTVLLNLLQILDATDVLIIVSWWYGGIHLGPDRFKHISNVARSLLSSAGFIRQKSKAENKKPQKR